MFTIRNYETPNQYKFVTLRSERIKRQKRILFYTGLLRNIAVAGAILFFIAVIGYVGNNDLEMELINQGYTQAEAKELMK